MEAAKRASMKNFCKNCWTRCYLVLQSEEFLQELLDKMLSCPTIWFHPIYQHIFWPEKNYLINRL